MRRRRISRRYARSRLQERSNVEYLYSVSWEPPDDGRLPTFGRSLNRPMSSSLFSLKRGLVVGSTVLVLGGSAVGIASAQTAPATPAPQAAQTQSNQQAFLDALAKRLNITTSALQTAISGARSDVGLPAGGGFGPGGRGDRGGGRGMDL